MLYGKHERLQEFNYVTNKFSIITAIFLRSVIITAVLVGAGYVANMKLTVELINGIKNGIALVPAIIMVIGLLFIVILYKITPKNLEKMQKEVEQRKVK